MTDLSSDALVAQALADAQEKPAAKGGGMMQTVAIVGILSLFAIGAGALVGSMVGGQSAERAQAALKSEKAAVEAQAQEEKLPPETPNAIFKLQPIITNIATPPAVSVRIQASIVYRKSEVADPEILGAEVQADTLAFLRTIDLAQIEGARGLLHLKEDLTERAKLRSPAIGDYLIESLIAQ